MKCVKEARFCARAAIVLVDSEEVGTCFLLLDCTEKKIMIIKEWDDAAAKEIKRVKSLASEKGK